MQKDVDKAIFMLPEKKHKRAMLGALSEEDILSVNM